MQIGVLEIQSELEFYVIFDNFSRKLKLSIYEIDGLNPSFEYQNFWKLIKI